MPPGAAELAVGHRLQADQFLLGHELPDLGVLDRLELGRRDLARGAPGARFLDGAVRSRLPTWSARKGGLVRCTIVPLRRDAQRAADRAWKWTSDGSLRP